MSSGGYHIAVIVPSTDVKRSQLGLPGVMCVRTASLMAALPVPTAFVAVTVNVYSFPLSSPVIVVS